MRSGMLRKQWLAAAGVAVLSAVACGGAEYVAPTPVPVAAQAASAASVSPRTYAPTTLGQGVIFRAEQYDGPRPLTFQENPKFTELVKRGELPPVEQRLPVAEDVLVLDVPDEIGIYGGTWRLASSGWLMDIAQFSKGECLTKAADGETFVVYACEKWSQSDDGRIYTFTLRRGTKWSDGVPLTMDDVMFGFNDTIFNKEFDASEKWRMWDPLTQKFPKVEAVDDWTFSIKYENPYYNFLEGGRSRGPRCRVGCWYGARQHLYQFHPKYASSRELNAKLEETGMPGWVDLFKSETTAHGFGIIKVPHIGPYLQTYGRSQGDRLEYKANPYHFAVDPEGNQLPYLDGIISVGYESRPVAVFRALAGEHDAGSVIFVEDELPIYQTNMEKGDYSLYSYPTPGGPAGGLSFNQTFNDDPEIGRLMRTKDFRIALSLAIDREAVNEINYLGLGMVGNAMPPATSPLYLGPEWESLDAAYDLARSNQILDSLGLVDTDGDGLRNRIGDLDGNAGNLELFMEIQIGGHAMDRNIRLAELNQDFLAAIGLQMEYRPNELAYLGMRDNRLYLGGGGGGATSIVGIWGNPGPFSAYWDGGGPLIGRYVWTDGKEGMGPTGPDNKWMPLAPEGTYPADSTGLITKLQELFREGTQYLPSDPRRIELGKEINKIYVAEKYSFNYVHTAGNRWGIMLKRNNFRNVPKHSFAATIGTFNEIYYFEDGLDNLTNPGNKSKRYKSESFMTGLSYD